MCSLISASNLSMGVLSFVVRIRKIFVSLSELLTQSLILLTTDNFRRHQKQMKISLPCREMRIFVLHEASFIILSFRMLIYAI